MVGEAIVAAAPWTVSAKGRFGIESGAATRLSWVPLSSAGQRDSAGRMVYRIQQGWLQGARWVPSPNCGPRPAQAQPDLLVIHNISLPPGEFGGDCIEQLFTNCLDWDAHPYFREIRGLEVSAHLLVRRDGEVLQFVSCDDRAWHAGRSCFAGRDNCNDFSIGIELEGSDDVPYTAAQYSNP